MFVDPNNKDQVWEVAILPIDDSITETKQEEINAYIQGNVSSWIRFCNDKQFTVKDLLSGEDWDKTPFEILYHIHYGSSEIRNEVEKDVGKLLKNFLNKDYRCFTLTKDSVNIYQYVRQ
jgi:hypothetical protein